jgi:transposase
VNSFPMGQTWTIGIDLSDRFTSFCVLDDQGEVQEEGKVRTTPEAFSRRFAGTEPCRMVMEVGTHSPWASKLLAGQGHEVLVANPWKVKLIAASITKTDRSDAETLARLGRSDPRLLSPVVHRSTQAHADLEVINARKALVASRSLLINHVRGAVKPFGTRLPGCDAHSFHKKVPEAIPLELSQQSTLCSRRLRRSPSKSLPPMLASKPSAATAIPRPLSSDRCQVSGHDLPRLRPDPWRSPPIQSHPPGRSLSRLGS